MCGNIKREKEREREREEKRVWSKTISTPFGRGWLPLPRALPGL
jgi:hypothetical protein